MKKKILVVLLSLAAALCLCFGIAACGGGGGNPNVKLTKISLLGVQDGISVRVGEEAEIDVDYTMDITVEDYLPEHDFNFTSSEQGVVSLSGTKDVEYKLGENWYKKVDKLTVKGEKTGKTTVTVSAGEGDLTTTFEVVVENYTQGLEYGEADQGYVPGKPCAACVGLGTAAETEIHIPKYVFAPAYGGDKVWQPVTQVSLKDPTKGDGITGVKLPESALFIELAHSKITSIAVPEGVTRLGGEAFNGCTLLASVELPGGLEQIGEGAFGGCTALKKLVVPNGCSVYGAFIENSGVEDLEINRLSSAEILKGVTLKRLAADFGNSVQLPDSLFESLEELIVKGGSVSTNNKVWQKLEKVSFLDKVTQVNDYAFYNCPALQSVIFGDGATEIRQSAFRNCTALTTVKLNDTIKKIGEYAFSGCTEIQSLTLGKALETIESGNFTDCKKMDNVTTSKFEFSDGKGTTVKLHNLLPLKDTATNTDAELITLTIPEGTQTIPNDAFSSFGRLKAIVLPTSLTSCYGEYPADFAALTNLESVTVSGEGGVGGKFRKKDGVLYFENQDGLCIVWVDKDASGSVELLTSLTAIPEKAFLNRTQITAITLPAGLKTIGDSAFAGAGLTAITIPEANSLHTVGDSAFMNTSLTQLPANLLKNLTAIPQGAFAGCTSLTSVNIPDNITVISARAFNGCTQLATLEGGTNVYNIGGDAFKDTAWFSERQQTKGQVIYAFDVAYSYVPTSDGQSFEVTLKEGTKGVADAAFEGLRLTKVTIPASVKYIGFRAFRVSGTFAVHYEGTEQQWGEVTKTNDWSVGTPTMTYGNNA